jgi:hypothetical protein
MPTARVLCGLTLTCEVYDELDDPDARRRAEAERLLKASENSKSTAAPKVLNVEGCTYVREEVANRKRPVFVLRNLAPLAWSIAYTPLRRPDEFTCTIPVRALPVPASAVRSLTVTAVIRHVSADEWSEGLLRRGAAIPTLAPDQSNADFWGVCTSLRQTLDKGLPVWRLAFHDFLGLLANLKVRPGMVMDRTKKITEAIGHFLVGTPAEGLCIAWVDTEAEPTVDQHLPKVQKQPKKPTSKPVGAQQSFLDAINEECARLGCVARVRVLRLEVARAKLLYEGTATTSRALLLEQSVESLEAEHQLVGLKTKTIQAIGYNPDTGQMLQARWPPDPKGVAPLPVEAGQPPRLPPLVANVGLPGYEQLDDNLLPVPVGPIASKEKLLAIAQMVFLERARQRIVYTLKTAAPWSDSSDPDREGGDLLRLRAGDTVALGLGETATLVPPETLGLLGNIGTEGYQQLLVDAGVHEEEAARIAGLITRVPRLGFFWIEELRASAEEKQPAELSMKLVNFTEILNDFQGNETTQPPGSAVADLEKRREELRAMPKAQREQLFREAFAAAAREENDQARAALLQRTTTLYLQVRQ